MGVIVISFTAYRTKGQTRIQNQATTPWRYLKRHDGLDETDDADLDAVDERCDRGVGVLHPTHRGGGIMLLDGVLEGSAEFCRVSRCIQDSRRAQKVREGPEKALRSSRTYPVDVGKVETGRVATQIRYTNGKQRNEK